MCPGSTRRQGRRGTKEAVGEFGGFRARLALHETAEGAELCVAGAGRIAIFLNGRPPQVVEQLDEGAFGLLDAALEGPATILTLALRGRFCLHCSAVETPAGAILLSGPSGAGKSTLAAALLERGLPRLADDLLPVGLIEEAPHCFPHFSQPRLPAGEQVGPEVPEALPVAAVLFLDPTVAAGETRPLVPAEAVLALARATAAVTLFPAPVHTAHLKLCAALVRSAQLAVAGYPHRPGAVTAIKHLIRALFTDSERPLSGRGPGGR